PEIGRAGALADWQLGVVAGALGFARMATAIPACWLAGRYLGTTLCVSPALMLAGTVLLAASSSFSVLVLGRLILGFAYTLGTVSGLIALLLDDRGPEASVRLNIFEFSAMIGVLGGLGLVGLLPSHWGWSLSLLIASSPLHLILAAVPSIRRRFPDASRAPETRASRTSDAGRGPGVADGPVPRRRRRRDVLRPVRERPSGRGECGDLRDRGGRAGARRRRAPAPHPERPPRRRTMTGCPRATPLSASLRSFASRTSKRRRGTASDCAASSVWRS